MGFLGLALAAIALVTGLTVAFAAPDVRNLVTHQRTDLTAAIAGAAAASWAQQSSWHGADLSPTLDLASRAGVEAQILDQNGSLVTTSAGFEGLAGMPEIAAPVVFDAQRVGTVVVRFSGSGLGSADHALSTALVRAVAAAAGLAVLLALLFGIVMARRLTRPVEKIISVTRAMGSGKRSARVGEVRAPGEVRELASALDQMADMLARNEQVRRDLVADVAHELRTPVAVLLAGHEALVDGFIEATPDQLSSLRDEVLRLARMVDDLQMLAAADAAVLQLERHPSDLADIAGEAADSLAGRFGATGITLERHLESAEVMADPRWMHQVVTNLLTNALKFSGPAARSASTRASLAATQSCTSRTAASASPLRNSRAYSTGSGVGGAPRRYPAAALASPSRPRSLAHTAGASQPSASWASALV